MKDGDTKRYLLIRLRHFSILLSAICDLGRRNEIQEANSLRSHNLVAIVVRIRSSVPNPFATDSDLRPLPSAEGDTFHMLVDRGPENFVPGDPIPELELTPHKAIQLCDMVTRHPKTKTGGGGLTDLSERVVFPRSHPIASTSRFGI